MLRTNKYDYDIFILGGGTAGIRAAQIFSQAGKRVGIAEPGEFGGYEKTDGYGERAPLIQAAELYTAIKNSATIGIRGGSVGYNYPTIREWSRTVRGGDDSKAQLKADGVQLFDEKARFISPHEISLGRQHVTSAQFFIAAGSTVNVPRTINGLADVPYLTSKTATELIKPPKSIFIIGGGKTGVEFAGLFSSFGAHVAIAEIAPRLLPEEDIEAGDAIKAVLEARNSEVLSSTRVTSVSRDGAAYRITYLRGDVEHVMKAEQVLLAGGRTPNLDLGLENAEVDYSPLGVTVSASLQTSAKHIYAAGSITGNVRGPEGALLEAELAATNMLRRERNTVSYASLPSVVYSQPIVARVGTNEGESLRKDIPIATSTAQLGGTVIGRSARDNGLIKLVADKKGTLIGAVAIGQAAAEAINTLALAVESGLSIEKVARLPLAFGTTGEAITVAARTMLSDVA